MIIPACILYGIGYISMLVMHNARTPGEPISNAIASIFWPVSVAISLLSRMQ